ncbi:MAG: PilW family protein [Xanthomonadales bacterium]|nr:PilW family protein [Xanthomonadales bacterium]
MKNITHVYARGTTIIELMIAMVLGLLLTGIIIALFSNAKASYRLQDGLTRIQEDGRVAVSLIGEEVRKAGFRKPVWNDPMNGYSPITDGSVNGTSNSNDTLQFMYMSDTDCTGAINTNIDPETTEPVADYKQMTFAVDGTGTLLWSCAFGTNPDSLTVQSANQPVIDGVESFQVLYGVDTDFPPDFSINAWTTADNIEPKASVCMQSQYLCEAGGLLNDMLDGVPVAIKLAVLIASPETAESETISQSFDVLDVPVTVTDNDRLMRKVYTTTVTLRNMTI